MHSTLGSPPSLHRGKTSLSPLHSHLIWHPSCFSAPCPLRLSPDSLLSISTFFFPSHHLFKCAKKKIEKKRLSIAVVLPDFKKVASEKLKPPLHERFTLG